MRAIRSAFVPTLGYFSIAMFSVLSGTAISVSQRNGVVTEANVSGGVREAVWQSSLEVRGALQGPETYNLVFFLSVVATFFLVRYVLVDLEASHYERREERDYLVRIADFAIFGVVVALIVHILTQVLYVPRPTSNTSLWRELLLSLSIAIPAITWMVTTRRLISEADAAVRHDAFNFANRVYFPSLVSSFLCFLYGWMLLEADGITSSFVVLIVSLFISGFYVMSLKAERAGKGPSARTSIIFILLFVFILPFLTLFFPGADSISAVFFALVAAFALGVSEVGQRIFTHPAQNRVMPSTEGEVFYLAGANWSALTLIPSVPLLGLLNPTIPVWFMCLYSVAYLGLWLLISEKKSSLFSWTCIGMGFLLPVWIFLATAIGSSNPKLLTLVNGESVGTGVSLAFGLLVLALAALGVDQKSFIKLFRNELEFAQIENALLLFITVAIFVVLYTTGVSSFVHWFTDEIELSYRKIWEIQLFTMILIVIALVIYIFLSKFDPRGGNLVRNPTDQDVGDEASSDDDRASKATSSEFVVPMVLMGRPLISAIAGLAVVVLLLSQGFSEIEKTALAGSTILLATMFGFVINDIFDLDKDIAGNRIDKMLVNRSVSQQAAKLLAVTLLATPAGISLIWFGSTGLFFVLALCVTLAFYSTFSTKIPYAKGLYTALLCMSPLPFAEIVLGTRFVPVNLYLFGILYFLGRELLFDAVDYDADQRAGVKTLAVVMGLERSIPVSWLMMALAIILMLPVVSELGAILVIANVTLLGVFAWIGRSRLLLSSNLTRINLLLGLGAVANALA